MQPSPFMSYNLNVHRKRSYTEPRNNVDNVTSKSCLKAKKKKSVFTLILSKPKYLNCNNNGFFFCHFHPFTRKVIAPLQLTSNALNT